MNRLLWSLIIFLLLFSGCVGGEAASKGDSIFYNQQLPRCLKKACAHQLTPADLDSIYSTYHINDSFHSSISGMYKRDSTWCWSLFTKSNADTVILLFIPPRELTLKMVESFLSRYHLQREPMPLDWSQRYHSIQNEQYPLTAMVYGNDIVAHLIVKFPQFSDFGYCKLMQAEK